MSWKAPAKKGRLFLRTHGDCFLHATGSWLNYWPISLSSVSLLAILAGRLKLSVQVWVCVHARATPVRYETVVFALKVNVRGHEEAKEVTVRECLPLQTQVLRD